MESGHIADALAASKEAIAAWRKVAAQDPRQLPALARSLGFLSVRASRIGDVAEALEAAVESVKHWRVLVEQDPSRHGIGLVNALVQLGPKVHRVHFRN